MKNIDVFIKEKLEETQGTEQNVNEGKLERGSQHGNDAWILFDDGETVTILVGGYDEKDALKAKALFDEDKTLGEFEDAVEYVEKEEWNEQQ